MHEESVNHHERKADAMKRDLIGQQLGNYRLINLLGRGGFAEVYLGQHIRLRMQVAIKVLHTHLPPEEIEQFQREAETIANLVHPHIVRVFDFDVANGIPFLVMDNCPNGTLRQRHPKGERVQLPTIVSYIKQVADALQYAHENKFIHRDIKPENMLIGHHNALLLSDFGIVATAHSTSSMSTQVPVGTIFYMAPEQIQAQARPASDQYALGIVVYEWLCGTRPFEGSYTEIFAKHLMTPPPPLREKVSTLPPEVEQVVLIALAKDPHQRFATVQAFATALEQASQSGQSQTFILPKPVTPSSQLEESQPSLSFSEAMLPNQSPPPIVFATPPHPSLQPVMQVTSQTPPSYTPEASDISRPISQPTSHPSRRAVIAGLVGLTLVGSGIMLFAIPQCSTPPKIASHVTPLPIGTLLYTYKGHSDQVFAVAWSPDGNRIASGSADETVQVWDAVDGGNTFTYKGHSDVVHAVAWSPGGKRIASASWDKTVQVWDAVDGGNVFIYQEHRGAVRAVAWSLDGIRLASGSVDETVQVWDAADGGNAFTYKGHSNVVQAVSWSPDGKRLASASWDKTVQVWDAVDGGNVYTYQGHANYVNAAAWSPDGKRIASASSDNTVQVWDAVDGGNVFTYQGHHDVVFSVAWSLDGKRIASASADETVQVWDAMDGGNVFTYQGHANPVHAVAWSPDGKYLASGSWDKTAQVWEAS
jgi:WD40 repeat protein